MIKRTDNREKGSATVEAVISFTGFLFLIFTILNVVNFCRTQMLISNAVDTVAKELSQYSYFYEMSGLQKFSDKMSGNAEIGTNNINSVVNTLDGFYTSITSAAGSAKDNAQNIADAASAGDGVLDSIQTTLTQVSGDAKNITASMNSVMNSLQGIGDDPILYLKSIVAIAGNTGLDLIKSHLIAAPLSRLLIEKHFKTDEMSADETLKKMGVVNGFDGLNFNMSTLFSSKEPKNVHIVLYYRIHLVNFFGFEAFEVPVRKEAVAVAWLGGDNVLTRVTPAVVSTPEQDNTGDNENEETTGEGSETTNPQNEPVDTTGSLWYPTEEDIRNGLKYQEFEFDNRFKNDYNVDVSNAEKYLTSDGNHRYYFPEDTDSVFTAYSYDRCVCADDISADFTDVLMDIKEMSDSGEKNIDFSKMNSVKLVIYVPENISDEEYAAIDAKLKEEMMNSRQEAYYLDLLPNVGASYEIVRAGGNYDYGEEEET